MKKTRIILVAIVIILGIVGIIYYNGYNDVRTFDLDGYIFTSDNVTSNLVNGQDATDSEVSYEKVKYDDTLYESGGQYFIGKDAKINISLAYPIVSSDSNTLLILSDQGYLIDSSFRRTTTYANSLISDNKLFNENNYERADNVTYYFVELNNSIFINLSELTISLRKDHTIPVNSFISFSDESLRYYYLKEGKYIYKEITGLDQDTPVIYQEREYSYGELLERLGLFVPEDKIPELGIAPEFGEGEDGEGDGDGDGNGNGGIEFGENEKKYVKPTVTFGNQNARIYSITGKLEVSDSAGRIVKYPTFEFWKDGTIVLRKSFVNSDTIEIKGLYPDATYEVVGTFNYKNENNQEVKSEFTRFKISTKDISGLESIQYEIEDLNPSYNFVDFVNVTLKNDASDEVLKGLKKVMVNIGNNHFQLGQALVNKLARLEAIDYSTSKSLTSNTRYDVSLEFYDIAGNLLQSTSPNYSFKTTNQAPSGSLAVKNREISKASLKFEIVNKDNVNIANMHYVVYDTNKEIVKEAPLDNVNLELDDLEANEVYSIYLYGDYDLEDGKGIKKDQMIVEGKFTTEPLSTLGYVKLKFSNIESDIDRVSYNLSIASETNETLMKALTSIDVVVKNITNNAVAQTVHLTDEQFESLINGNEINLTTDGLESNHTYYFDLVSHVKLGRRIYDIKTLCNISSVKTLKLDAEVVVINKFITENMINFDVRIDDTDGAIQSNRVILEGRDYYDVLIYYNELEINGDYVNVEIDKLEKEQYYTFTYKVEEYNIGFDNTTFETNYKLYEEKILTEEGLYGSVAIESLLKQITGKNIFDITNNRRWRSAGDRDIARRKVDTSTNTISLGGKNGYRTYAYYIPEYRNQQVTVSFFAKYESADHTRPVYLAPNGLNNRQTYLISTNQYNGKQFCDNTLSASSWAKCSLTLTVDNSSPYIGFTIVEVSGNNNITTILLKDLQIEKGSQESSYTAYTEAKNYMGTFITNLTDRNHEIPLDDFHYYIRYFKNNTLVDSVEFDFNDTYTVVDAASTHEIEPVSNYEVKLSIRRRVAGMEEDYRYYDLASVDFNSDDEIRTIRTVEEFFAIHTSGIYLVAADLDFSNRNTKIDNEFNGTIDFQGHKVIRDTYYSNGSTVSARYLFWQLGSSAVLKNLDIHYYLDDKAISDYNGLAYYNYGTIENFMITLEQGNNKGNVIIALCVRQNYGIIRNFVVNSKEALSVERSGSLMVTNNYGTIMNGYLYGKNIDASFYNSTLDYKYVGGVAAYTASNSYVANIYSLVGVDSGEVDTNETYQMEVGNILGRTDRSIVRNVYTYSEGANRNQSKDLNIYSGTMNVSNVYYATLNDYQGTYSSKISPSTLRQESFQNILNADNAFNIEDFVKYGYFPHLILPDCMPNQEYIALPKADDGELDFLTMEDRVENGDETVEATLVFQNVGYDTITSLSFNKGLDVTIKSQTDSNGISKVRVLFTTPDTYVSVYSLVKIKHNYATGREGPDIVYNEKQRKVEVDMYRNVRNITEFQTYTSRDLTQNFKLQTDLDFNNLSYALGTLTGKIDGNGHTMKNIRLVDKAFIGSVSGGTVKNLYVDTFVKSGNGGYGGFIAQASNGANIENVHLKNVAITDSNTYVGSLIGYTNGALISNCTVTNTHIYETNKNNIVYYGRYGGLIGENNNTVIQNSYVQQLKMDITYASSTFGLGGMVGRHNSGYVEDSYAEGVINTNQQEVGGIAGYNSAYIERCISVVDIYTQQDSVGGIAGYSTNQNVFNTLAIGGVYSAKDVINRNRTIGNQTAVNSNFAWDQQLIDGLVSATANGDILLTSEELQSDRTYDGIIGLGDQFVLTRLVNSKGHSLIPKLKYLSQDTVLPNQRDIEFYHDEFRVSNIETTQSLNSATIAITIINPGNHPISSVVIDGLNTVRVNRNVTTDGVSVYEIDATPDRYYDSYRISAITYLDSNNQEVTIDPAAKIQLTFYKDLAGYEDWQQIDGDVYENYRLIADIDFAQQSALDNVKSRVSFNRLEGTDAADGGHTLKNMSVKALGLIDTVAANISNVNFENITVTSNSSTNYVGVIRFLNGTMSNVNFNGVTITTSGGSYVGTIANNQAPDIRDVTLNNITISGATHYVGGFIGKTRAFDITQITGTNINVSASGDLIGGLIGWDENTTYATMFNFTVDEVTVRGRDEVGGIFGRGAGDRMIGSNVHITGRHFVGGLFGRHYITYSEYGYLKDSDITGSGYYIGGMAGYSYRMYYYHADNLTVKGTRANANNYVGGISGFGGWGVYYGGIRNSTITNAGNYTGGIRGYLNYAACGYDYVYNTKIQGQNYVGGIAGSHGSTSSTIYYNISNAEVIATGSYAGGLIGYLNNLYTTDASNKIYIYRNIVAGSKVTVQGLYAGSIAGNSNALPFYNHFYDNFVVASVNSPSGNISQFFIGNDDANGTYTNELRANNSNARGIRVYEGSTYNGVAISTHNYPGSVTKYTESQLRVQSTFSGLLQNTFNFSQVTNGYYPYLTYTWNNSGIQYFTLPSGTLSAISTNQTTDESLGTTANTSFPSVKVYATDVDKINVEFSRIDSNFSFKINNESHDLTSLTYTYYYDFLEDFEIELSDGINTKVITIAAEDVKSTSSVDGNNYYYINKDSIVSNDKASAENMSSKEKNYKVKLLADTDKEDNKPVNIYDTKVLLANQNIYDLKKKTTIENSFENLTLTDTLPLYSFVYGENTIETYYNYSVVNNEVIGKQVFVKDNKLEVIDSTLDNVKDNILVDQYNGDSHVIYLGVDGKLHSLKDDIEIPKKFKNGNIKSISTDMYDESDIIFVLYENNDYVVFNYRNGEVIEESMENSNDLISYFTSYFTNTSTSNKNARSYQDSLSLIKKIKTKDMDAVLGKEEQTSGNKQTTSVVDAEYTSVYNPVTEKYEVYKIPSAYDNSASAEPLDAVLTEASTTNEIDNNNVLYHFYIGKAKQKKTLIISVLAIVVSIISGIGVAIFLLRKNMAVKE